jgi:hypothetical protein
LNKGNALNARITAFKSEIGVVTMSKERPKHYSCILTGAEEDLNKIWDKVYAVHLELLNTALRKAEREFKAL